MSEPLLANEARFLFVVNGVDADLAVLEFTVTERISHPFDVDLALVSEDEVDFDAVIGKEALLTVRGEEEDRYFHGVVTLFRQTGRQGRFYLYEASTAPSLWLLSLEWDSRILQNKSAGEDNNVQAIVSQILEEGHIAADCFEFRLQEPEQYTAREFCVQYQESDLRFISRLLEEEGIFYFFEHTEEKHLLVFGNGTVNYQPIPGESSDIPFNPGGGLAAAEEAVTQIILSREIHTGQVNVRCFNYEQPSLEIKGKGEAETFTNLEVYNYSGRYPDQTLADRQARVCMQAALTYRDKAQGQSVSPRFTPGFTFALTDHDLDRLNQDYLLVEVVHSGYQPQALEETAASGGGGRYSNQFLAIPATAPFCPERKTPSPFIRGSQTAIVTGPSDEEIYTDELGRVKVHFHWDRERPLDETSSCWLRVSQVHAGAGFGGIDIPRIGEEVIVDFLEGDPDRPIVTGRVYHGGNLPPTGLPAAGMVSGMKSNSTPGGGGYNEMSMNDTKGEESMTIHAQYDMGTTVEHDQSNTVNNKFTETIKSDATITITEGNYSHEVATGTAKYHVVGALTEDFDATQDTKVKGNLTIKSTGGTIAISSDSAHVNIDAATKIKLNTGASSIVMDSGGNIEITGTKIKIAGANVSINGDSSVAVSGGVVHSEAKAEHQTKGAIVVSEGSATNTVKGGMIMLNP